MARSIDLSGKLGWKAQDVEPKPKKLVPAEELSSQYEWSQTEYAPANLDTVWGRPLSAFDVEEHNALWHSAKLLWHYRNAIRVVRISAVANETGHTHAVEYDLDSYYPNVVTHQEMNVLIVTMAKRLRNDIVRSML